MRNCPKCKRPQFAEKKRYCHYCGTEITPARQVKVVRNEWRPEPSQPPDKKRARALIAGVALGVVLIVTVIVSVSRSGGGTSTETGSGPGTETTTGGYPATGTTTVQYAAPATSYPTETKDPSDPATVVTNYYAAVDRHDYRAAWDLGGSNLSKSYATFTKGYATTESETLTIVGTSGNTVNIDLSAVQSDGTIRYYEGSYTVSSGKIIHGTLRLTSTSG